MKVNALLGDFPFAINTAMFQQVDRTSAEDYASNKRIGRRDAHQHLGAGAEEITLPGYIMPLFTGANSTLSIDQLRAMKATGQSYNFIKVSNGGQVGEIQGQWIILSVDDSQTELFGAAAQRIDFTLKLRRVDG